MVSPFTTRVPALIITLPVPMTGIIVADAAADPLLRVRIVDAMVAGIVRLCVTTANKRAIS